MFCHENESKAEANRASGFVLRVPRCVSRAVLVPICAPFSFWRSLADTLVKRPVNVCDCCGNSVHDSCYGFDNDADDESPWFCQRCCDTTRRAGAASYDCALCTRVGVLDGLFVRFDAGSGSERGGSAAEQWVHASCAILHCPPLPIRPLPKKSPNAASGGGVAGPVPARAPGRSASSFCCCFCGGGSGPTAPPASVSCPACDIAAGTDPCGAPPRPFLPIDLAIQVRGWVGACGLQFLPIDLAIQVRGWLGAYGTAL